MVVKMDSGKVEKLMVDTVNIWFASAVGLWYVCALNPKGDDLKRIKRSFSTFTEAIGYVESNLEGHL